MDQPLRAIADTLGIRLKTVRRAACNRRFPVERIGNMLLADIEAVRHHFATCKPGRPHRPIGVTDELVEALLWTQDKDGNDLPTLPCLTLYSQCNLSYEDFDRFMAFCDREPALADKIMESIDEGQIWVPDLAA